MVPQRTRSQVLSVFTYLSVSSYSTINSVEHVQGMKVHELIHILGERELNILYFHLNGIF